MRIRDGATLRILGTEIDNTGGTVGALGEPGVRFFRIRLSLRPHAFAHGRYGIGGAIQTKNWMKMESLNHPRPQ